MKPSSCSLSSTTTMFIFIAAEYVRSASTCPRDPASRVMLAIPLTCCEVDRWAAA